METLVIKPFGGLGNRLLVLDSVMNLQKVLSPKKTIIIWEQNPQFNCRFSDLFEIPDGLEIKETIGFDKFRLKSYFQIYNSFHPSNYRWSILNTLFGKERKYDSIYYSDDIETTLNKKGSFDPAVRKSLYISFYQRFTKGENTLFKFHPIPKHMEKVKEELKSFSKKTIGIHIRRSDHELSIKHSPTSEFIKKMNHELDHDDTVFFLSSDSDEEKNTLKNHFGSKLITRDIAYSRGCQSGIEDALIDMLCLANTKEIWGSYNSTFSQVAAEMGGVNLQVISDNLPTTH